MIVEHAQFTTARRGQIRRCTLGVQRIQMMLNYNNLQLECAMSPEPLGVYAMKVADSHR